MELSHSSLHSWDLGLQQGWLLSIPWQDPECDEDQQG